MMGARQEVVAFLLLQRLLEPLLGDASVADANRLKEEEKGEHVCTTQVFCVSNAIVTFL